MSMTPLSLNQMKKNLHQLSIWNTKELFLKSTCERKQLSQHLSQVNQSPDSEVRVKLLLPWWLMQSYSRTIIVLNLILSISE